MKCIDIFVVYDPLLGTFVCNSKSFKGCKRTRYSIGLEE